MPILYKGKTLYAVGDTITFKYVVGYGKRARNATGNPIGPVPEIKEKITGMITKIVAFPDSDSNSYTYEVESTDNAGNTRLLTVSTNDIMKALGGNRGKSRRRNKKRRSTRSSRRNHRTK